MAHRILAGRRYGPRAARRGATVVEMAMVAPTLFLLLIGMVVAGLGVFRYHQVVALAHEGARWASVRGPEYRRQSRSGPLTSKQLFNEVIRPRAAGLESDRITYSLEWNEDQSMVTVTVGYNWLPEAFLGSKTFVSTSRMLVTH